MFNKVFLDLLFNLLLTFVCLFFLAFILVNKSKKQEENIQNKNNILIIMRWETDNDVDLWLKSPDSPPLGFNNRDVPPAHLDIDVVKWRQYRKKDTIHNIKHNEEIIAINQVVPGEYAVNIHYYDDKGYKNTPINVELYIQDIKNKQIVYACQEVLKQKGQEKHVVKFTVKEYQYGQYGIVDVTTDDPVYFVARK